jgi:hypothetical protein
MAIYLKVLQTGLRVIQLLASVACLAIFSYFLAVLSDHNLPIANWIRAVEGISGAAVLYGIFAVLLTSFLGGVPFFAFLAMVLDVCFIGGFVAIAVLTRNGASSCTGFVKTPLGNGNADNNQAQAYGDNGFGFGKDQAVTYLPNLYRSCKLETAVFSIACIQCLLFLLTLLFQLALGKQHQKEKRYGPSPANNYTSGSGRRTFWPRRRRGHIARDAEVGAIGAGALAAKKHHDHHDHHDHHNEPVADQPGDIPTAGVNGGYGAQGYDRPSAYGHNTPANF